MIISKRKTHRLASVFVAFVVGLSGSVAIARTSFATGGVMNDQIYQVINPTSSNSILTPWSGEATNAVQWGYTQKVNVFQASVDAGTGLVPVSRLYHPTTQDFATESDAATKSALIAAGYQDQGIKFYASASKTAATQPVYRYLKDGKRRYAMTPSYQVTIELAGWRRDAVVYYAVPNTADVAEFTAAPGAFDDTVYQVINPSTSASTLTTSAQEVYSSSTKYGFTEKDELFLGSKDKGVTNLVPVYRYYKGSVNDFATEQSSSQNDALIAAGYVKESLQFYASSVAGDGLQPVYRYLKNNKHRYAMAPSDQSAAEAAGWTKDGVAFYAKPTAANAAEFTAPPVDPPVTPPSDVVDGKFTFIQFPDTQQEVYSFSQNQFDSRTKYVVDQQAAQDIRFVAHTGDVVSDGGDVTRYNASQFQVASDAYKRLDTANIPYLFSMGNHDTAVVCPGGSACKNLDGTNYTYTQLNNAYHDASVFDRYFPLTTRVKASGSWQGSNLNSYRTFSAEGADWLVLSIEMAPRQAALDWAKSVVAAHPSHNVIVLSHSLVTSSGAINGGNEGYGNLPITQVYNQLILAYPNVKMAFSGHVNGTSSRVDTGVNGNKVVSYLTCFHDSDFNQLRQLTIDVTNGKVSSHIVAPTMRPAYKAAYPSATIPDYTSLDVTYDNMNFIKR